MIASYYNCVGHQKSCEKIYSKYVELSEKVYQTSVETGNAYFMLGTYYFEQTELAKSMACYMKTL